MNTPQPNVKSALVIIVVLAAAALVAQWYVATSLSAATEELESSIDEQIDQLQARAETSFTNAIAPEIQGYVQDCRVADRSRFDVLLDGLATLNANELDELDALYAICADHFADRKAALVALLTEDVQALEALVTSLETLNSGAKEQYQLSGWQEFVAGEKEQADLLRQQVALQAEIIRLLALGESVQGESVRLKAEEAQSLLESASVLRNRINEVYSSLMKL